MEGFDSLELRTRASEVDAPVTEMVGDRLPRPLRRIVSREEYEYLRQCKPFGSRPVREVARESGLRPERLWRRLHRARIELEFFLLEQFPYRIEHLIDHGRELREQGGKLDHAEQYLKRARVVIPKLGLPDVWRDWSLANACLQLGHVFRDRGDENRRHRALATYRESRDVFLRLCNRNRSLWSEPDFACGWIVADQNALQMNKIFAEYQPAATSGFCEIAVRGYEQIIEALRNAPRSVERYRERKAESLRFIGEHVLLAGDARSGLRYLQEACRYGEGSTGDHLSRVMHRAEAWSRIGKYEEAFFDLERAQRFQGKLVAEKGIYGVLLGKQYCKLYKMTGNSAVMQETAEAVLRSANRLGLLDQKAKMERLLRSS